MFLAIYLQINRLLKVHFWGNKNLKTNNMQALIIHDTETQQEIGIITTTEQRDFPAFDDEVDRV